MVYNYLYYRMIKNLKFKMKYVGIDCIYKKLGKKAILLATRVDKSDLQVYSYFWQTYRPIAGYEAKNRDKLVNHSCQLVWLARYVALFPYFLYMQSIPTLF